MNNNNFEVTSLHEEILKGIREKIEIVKKEYVCDSNGDIKIDTDYNDRNVAKNVLEDIFESEDPRQAFSDKVYEMEFDYEQYVWDDIVNECKAILNDDELEFIEDADNEYDFMEIIRDNFHFYYDINDFNIDINVNIMVDCGNLNSDYTDDDFGYYGHRGNIPETSSMLWLATQQGKGEEFKAAVKSWYNGTTEYVERDTYDDPFIESMIQEVENLPSSIATLTFLVKMSLFDVFDCIEIQKREYDEKFKYEPQLNENAKSYIEISKKAECGLFNNWDGGGSCLEIKLDKNVELPLKYCRFAVDGCHLYGRYDVKEVYSLTDDFWKGTVEVFEVG